MAHRQLVQPASTLGTLVYSARHAGRLVVSCESLQFSGVGERLGRAAMARGSMTDFQYALHRDIGQCPAASFVLLESSMLQCVFGFSFCAVFWEVHKSPASSPSGHVLKTAVLRLQTLSDIVGVGYHLCFCPFCFRRGHQFL